MVIKQIKYRNKVWFFLHFFAFAGIIVYVLYVINLFMKKTFIQVWQYILRHKKRLIYGALALSISQICLLSLWWIWLQSDVFAADAPNNSTSNTYMNEKVWKWLDEFSFFKVIINVLIYPILIIAWKLVDNSLVYWEVFWFDAILRNLWVMIRNIANFWLWFLFIYKICEYLIKWQKSWDMKKLLISVLIAWIWIQASWFIMSVLIDASTIITYGVWWLPITVLEDTKENKNYTNRETKNPYVLKTLVYYDANEPDKMRWYMATWNTYISECERFNYAKWQEETLLLCPRYIYYEDSGHYYPTKDNQCIYEGQVYFFWGLYKELGRPQCSWSGCVQEQNNYQGRVSKVKDTLSKNKNESEIRDDIVKWTILQVWDAHAASGINGNIFKWISYGDQHLWWDVDNNRNGSKLGLKKMNEVVESTNAWVFTELYATLLNLSDGVKITKAEAGSDAVYPKLLNEALRLLYALAIAIPLLAMVVVFVGRILLLWVAIPLSPIIVLITAFGLDSKITDKFLEKLKLENLIPIIFFPAIMCFVISLSAVLVKVIMSMNLESIQTEKMDILSWVIKLNIASFWVSLWKAITSILCVAITWFLAWTAIKSTKLWESELIKWMKDLAETSIWSLPVIPIPTKNWVETISANAAFWLNGTRGWIATALKNDVMNKFSKADTDAIAQILDDWWEKGSKQTAAYADVLKGTTVAQNRTSQKITISNGSTSQELTFNGMNASQQKEVIQKINETFDNDVKDKLWETKTIIIGEEEYTYNEGVHKYLTPEEASAAKTAPQWKSKSAENGEKSWGAEESQSGGNPATS